MAEIASAFVSILPSAKGFGSKLGGQIGPEVNGVGKKLGSSFGKAFAVAGAAVAAVGVGKFLKGAVGDAEEARRLNAITANAIKVTGAAAKVTTKQVQNLAGAIAAKTGIDDAQIQAGQNLILTFKNIANAGKGVDAIFDRTTQAAVDLSAAGFGSIEGASLQLGKALNDPLKGISALSRSGVTFTAKQKELIKGFVEQNDLLSAQKIILGEVESQVGGAGAASATASGKLAYAFGEFREAVGTALLPVVDKFATFLRKTMIPALNKGADAVGTIVRAFSYLFNGGEEGARGFAEIIDSAFGNTGRFIGPIQKVTEFMQEFLGAAVAVRAELFKRLQPVFDKFGDFVRKNPTFVKAFAIALGVLVGAIGAVTLATTLFSIALNTTGIPIVIIAIAALVAGLVVAYKKSEDFRNIVDSVAAAGKDFASFVKSDVVPVLVNLARTIATNVKPILIQLGQTFKDDILPVLQRLMVEFRAAQPTLQKIAGFFLKLAANSIAFAVKVASKVLPPLIRFAGFIVRTLIPGILDMIHDFVTVERKIVAFGGALVDAVRDAGKFLSGIKEKVGDAIAYLRKLPERAATALGNLGEALFQKGKDFIAGLLKGIKAGVLDAINYIKGVPGQLKGAFNGSGIFPALSNAIASVTGPSPAQGHEPTGNRFATITPRTSSGANGRVILQVGDREFVAYLREVADGVVTSASELAGERSRAQWSPA